MQNGNENQQTHEQPNIAFGTPQISETEINSVISVLKSGWLAHGPKTKEFEETFKNYCRAKYAIGVNSCTAALHLSLKALNIGPGDEVIVPAQTHVATAHAVMYQGATPVFADVEETTYNIDPKSIEQKITEKTKAIMPVHFAGQPCSMDKITSLTDKHNLHIIEDAAHALGAEYKNTPIGSTEGSSAACFSFYPVKHITTAEGGMLVTNNDKVAESANLTRAFGIDKSTWKRTTTERPWHYEVVHIGYNYRMNEISAALGTAQMQRIDEFNTKRQKNAKKLESGLTGIENIQLPKCIDNVKHVYLFYQVLISENSKITRDELIPALKKRGIGTSVHYPLPVHLMPVYKKLFGHKEGDLPSSEKIAKQAISLPTHPGLKDSDITYIINTIKELMN